MSNRTPLKEAQSSGNRPGGDSRGAQNEDSELDFGDVFLGVVYALIIPVVVYFGLSAVGLPVGGNSRISNEDLMAHNDRLGALVPPITRGEVQLRVEEVQRRMKLVSDYVRRSRATQDNQRKGRWLEYAITVLGQCRNDLEKIQSSLSGNPTLARDGALGERIQLWLANVAELERVIHAEDPFKGLRG